MKSSFLYSLFFILYSVLSFSQTKKVELLHANSLEFDEKLGKDVKRLIGNVQFRHEGVLMSCDSAYLYPNNKIDAFSNIHIQQGDTLNLFGQLLKYDGNTRMAEVQKNIRLSDKEMTLTTEQLFYDMHSSVATYTSGGTIVSKQNTLTSQKGYYHADTKSFSFKQNVVLTNPEYVMNSDTLLYNTGSKVSYFYGPTIIKSDQNFIYCENGWYDTEKNTSQFSKNSYLISKNQKLKGDSIAYDRNKGIGQAFRNVSIIDTSERIIIAGDYAIHNEETEKSIITKNALLKQFYEDDTLFLHSDTLCAITEYALNAKHEKDTSQSWRKVVAYHHVKFFKDDLQGKCDSLTYSDRDSLMKLFKAPVLWSEANQLTAEKINIKMSNGEIKNMFLEKLSMIISKVDTSSHTLLPDSLAKKDSAMYNQIKGKQMTGYFKDNNLVKIYVEGNGQTIYFAKDKEKMIGVNKAECSDLIIYLKENAVDNITFLKKPDATLFPMSDYIPDEFKLKNFIWRENERPLVMQDIFH
ncbi:MAG: organic solvent tolerance protein OstA [Bacteroidetes bacterium]|nr:organic solvent tolerance protein OstA [Bacteroidota bacterium]